MNTSSASSARRGGNGGASPPASRLRPDVAGHAGRSSEVTLLVEAGELPGGLYYLQCLKEGKVVGGGGLCEAVGVNRTIYPAG